MKKEILLLLTTFGTSLLVAQTNPTMQPGQTLPTDGVRVQQDAAMPDANMPQTVKTKFNTNYPNIDATWEMDGSDYAANYKDQGTNMGRTIVYDKNGNIVRTDNEVSNTSYPSAIADYYKKNYPNEDYKVWSSQDSNGNKTYYAKRKSSGTICFDKNGKYMTTKTDKNKQKTTTVKK